MNNYYYCSFRKMYCFSFFLRLPTPWQICVVDIHGFTNVPWQNPWICQGFRQNHDLGKEIHTTKTFATREKETRCMRMLHSNLLTITAGAKALRDVCGALSLFAILWCIFEPRRESDMLFCKVQHRRKCARRQTGFTPPEARNRPEKHEERVSDRTRWNTLRNR